MLNITGKLRDLWESLKPGSRVQAPFAVTCACGQTVSGNRRARHQVVRCPACQAEVFVLPRSPLPPVRSAADGQPAPTPPPARLRHWLLPGCVAAGALLLVIAVVGIVPLLLWTGWLSRGASPSSAAAANDRLAAVTHLSQADQALAEGKFQQAIEEYDAARQVGDRTPSALTGPERRRLQHGHAQAALLADLLTESLEEVLDRAAGLELQEWSRVFERRYKGKAFVLDTRLRRDAAGEYHLLDHDLRVGDEKIRLELAGLTLLRHLPLENPHRVVFGARLASAGRERGGWVVRLQPDSGVLLTVPGAFTACCSVPADEELRALFAKQEVWAGDLP